MNRNERRTRMLRQYQQAMRSDFAEQLRRADEGLAMPEMPNDVLAYLGNIESLALTDDETQAVRRLTQKVIAQKAAEYVWDNRVFLRIELSYINQTFGL